MFARLLTILFGPPYSPSVAGDASAVRRTVRWRWLPLRLVGPGSVPLALCLTAISDAFISDHYTNARFSLMFGLAMSAPLVLAGYQPLLAWFVAFGTFWVFTGTTAPVDPPQPWPWVPTALIAYLVVQFAVARRYGLAVALSGWLALVLAGILLTLDQGVPESTANLQLAATLSGFAILLGAAVRWRVRAQERLQEEERVSAEERERRRLLEERTRIARELHDIVAHHMSVIALQASSAPHRLSNVAEVASPVADEFDAISREARESLSEMRRLLAVLRSPEEPTEREPQPGVDAVGRLVESARAAGTPVQVEGVEDVGEDLSETVSLTGYRIVQEALSNVVRHAPGAPTTIRLETGQGRLTVTVTNRSAAGPGSGTTGQGSAVAALGGALRPELPERAGFGLVGMRERVEPLGGELSFGDRDDGGFSVVAVLPLAAAEVPGTGPPEAGRAASRAEAEPQGPEETRREGTA